LYLVRINKNYRGGWSNLLLTDEGIKQSQKLAKYFKSNINKFSIKKIIASDLKRASQTADIINKELNIDIEYTDMLREMNNGVIAGKLNEEVEKMYPGLYYNKLEMDEKYPCGESPIEFYNRIKNNFLKIINDNKNLDNIILVTHSGVINIIYHIVKDLEWSNKQKGFPVSTASIHRIILNENAMKLDIENLDVVN